MKHTLPKILALALCLAVGTSSLFAYDFEVDGIYYNFGTTAGTATVTSDASKYSGVVHIPETVAYEGTTYSVTEVGSSAFSGCSSLMEVTIPNSVTVIGDSAFYYCRNLTEVTIPSCVTEIGSYAFDKCYSVKKTAYPSSISNPFSSVTISIAYPKECFVDEQGVIYDADKTKVYYVPLAIDGAYEMLPTITEIGTSAFRYCSSLTEVTIPNSVTEIGSYAFYECSGLTEVTIPNGVTTIGGYAFRGCSGLTEVTIPNSVTTIGNMAFASCSGLTKITFIDGTEELRISQYNSDLQSAFSGGQIDTLYLGRNLSYSTQTLSPFRGCSIKTLIVGDSVTTIGEKLFDSQKDLTNVTMGNGVTSIGSAAFYNCSGLTTLTLGDQIKSIGSIAFSGCTSLVHSFTFDGTDIAYSAFNGCRIPTLTLTNMQTIKEESFRGCTIDTLMIDGAASIEQNTFKDRLLKALSISNVTTIGNEAFSASSIYSTLSIVTISNVQTIGQKAFYLQRFSELTLSDVGTVGVEAFASISTTSLSLVRINKIGHSAFLDPKISTLNLTDVTTIGDSAFFSRGSNMKAISMNGVIKTVGKSAFGSPYTIMSYPNLTGVYVNDVAEWCAINFADMGSNPLSYAQYLYVGEERVRDLVVPDGVTRIGDYAFRWYQPLTSVTLPESVTEIGDYAFQNCDSLISAIMPSVQTFGEQAFSGCYALAYAPIPSARIISKYAFFACRPLSEIDVPALVTLIDDYAFQSCRHVATIQLHTDAPIGRYAFSNCDSLKDLYCWAKTPNPVDVEFYPSNSPFDNTSIENATLHVPATSLELYRTTKPWSDFGTIVPIEEDFVLTYLIDGEVYKTDTLRVGDPIIAEPEPTKEGYTFSGWSEIPTTMPAEDVTVTGSVTVNYYSLTWMLDGEVYRIDTLAYGTEITAPAVEERAGYTFSGWSELPATMPAENITAEGSFSPILVAEITLTGTAGSLRKGKTMQLTATLQPAVVADDALTWTSSDEAIAEVDDSGLVTAVAAGTVTITATAYDGSGATGSIALTVLPVLLGDSNDDDRVTITDVVNTATYILGKPVAKFNAEAADVNGDDRITVADISGTAVIVLNPAQSGLAAVAPRAQAWTADGDDTADALTIDDWTASVGETATLAVRLPRSAASYVALQADIAMPEGMTLEAVTAGPCAAAHHTLLSSRLDGRTVRVALFDTEVHAFADGDEAFLELRVRVTDASAAGDITMTNVLATDAAIGEHRLTACGGHYAAGPTDLALPAEAEAAGRDAIYTLEGLMLGTTDLSTLPAGTYIVGGKKIMKR